MTNFEIAVILFWVSGATLAALFVVGSLIEVFAESKELRRCNQRRESREQERSCLQP